MLLTWRDVVSERKHVKRQRARFCEDRSTGVPLDDRLRVVEPTQSTSEAAGRREKPQRHSPWQTHERDFELEAAALAHAHVRVHEVHPAPPLQVAQQVRRGHQLAIQQPLALARGGRARRRRGVVHRRRAVPAEQGELGDQERELRLAATGFSRGPSSTLR